jgi:transcriptional regulator with XRE-family HTH domain
MLDVEQEATAEGPESSAQLRSLDSALHLAGQLLALRRRRGITQRQLSEMSGVQQADISRIERGQTQPTTVTVRRLAHALGADFGFYEIDAAGNAVPVEPVSTDLLGESAGVSVTPAGV